MDQNCFLYWEQTQKNFNICPWVENKLRIVVDFFLCEKFKYPLPHITDSVTYMFNYVMYCLHVFRLHFGKNLT